MEPNKFEKNIKKHLQEREIQPSANAWEQLSEKLDATAPESKKKSYFWYGIAASFIALFIISIAYLNLKNEVGTPKTQVVDVEDKTTEIIVVPDFKKEKNNRAIVVKNDKIDKEPVTLEVKTVTKNQVATVEEIDSVIDTAVEKIAISNGFEDAVINAKVLEVIAAVDSLEQNNAALTEVEVDNLLRNAQEEILQDKLFNQNGSVDAMALLTEVEDELDKSFRDQIFESLKTGFLKVRTAVADRNN